MRDSFFKSASLVLKLESHTLPGPETIFFVKATPSCDKTDFKWVSIKQGMLVILCEEPEKET